MNFPLFKHATIIGGVAELIDDYDGFFVDQWGVLHNGHAAHDGAVAALQYLKEHGKKTILISNSSRPPQVSMAMLEDLGFSRDLYDAVLTSGGLTRGYLQANAGKLGRHVYIFDDSGEPSDLLGEGGEGGEGLSYKAVGSVAHADFLLMARTATESLEDYEADLRQGIEKKLPMVCGNPDKVSVGIDGSLHYCPGAVADLYRRMGGEVIIFGKPERPIYDEALKIMGEGSKVGRVLVIGDSMEHDIAGGYGIGCDGLLIAAGIHRGELLPLSPAKVSDFFAGKEIMARYVCERFCIE